MDARLREQVRARASHRCEYCRIRQDADPLFRFHIEHIVPRQHEGSDTSDNLALACGHCNRRKGPNLAAIGPATGSVVSLYHPRQQVWAEHVSIELGVVTGLTEIGRATVRLLQMNEPRRIDIRLESQE